MRLETSKMRATLSLEASRIAYAATKRHISGARNTRLHRSANHKTHKYARISFYRMQLFMSLS